MECLFKDLEVGDLFCFKSDLTIVCMKMNYHYSNQHKDPPNWVSIAGESKGEGEHALDNARVIRLAHK